MIEIAVIVTLWGALFAVGMIVEVLDLDGWDD